MEPLLYRGYATHKISEATSSYKTRTQFDPRVVVCRPDYFVEDESDILVRSEHAAANMLMVTHLVERDHFSFYGFKRENIENDKILIDPKNDASVFVSMEEKETKEKTKETKKLEETRKPATCPHCKQKLRSFEYLGFWYGWSMGLIPPYWEDLKLYVFMRDGYTCQKCLKMFPENKLTAHHIQAKENGGVDSAKNLLTLCKDCHMDFKPIFDDN